MSKKDYIRIAAVVAAMPDRESAWRVADELADMFAADNNLFRRGVFYAACGVGDPSARSARSAVTL